jgi:hypothetical protein
MKVLDKDTILNHRMLHQVIPPLLLSRYPPHPPPPVHESKSNSSHSPLCFDAGDSFYTFFLFGCSPLLLCCLPNGEQPRIDEGGWRISEYTSTAMRTTG